MINRNSITFRILGKLRLVPLLSRLSQQVNAWSPANSFGDSPVDWQESLSDPTLFYKKCVNYFRQNLSEALRSHRKYFCQFQRGFGEDAFHVMWVMLFDKFKPGKFLEIGVYRGQVLSLISLLQKQYAISGSVTGIGPFERIGDATSVVNYGYCDDWLADTLKNFEHFGLPRPELLKALSTDQCAIERISSTEWDMIYIDGNHDYEVVVQDWLNCAKNVKIGGIIVLDDSGLGTLFTPPIYSFAGFPGPSQVANDAAKSAEFREILQVGHNRAFQRIK